MWLTQITFKDLTLVEGIFRLGPIYLVQQPGDILEFQLERHSPPFRPKPIESWSTRSPGVWVPPIGLPTRTAERPFAYTPRGLRELWSEITGTLSTLVDTK